MISALPTNNDKGRALKMGPVTVYAVANAAKEGSKHVSDVRYVCFTACKRRYREKKKKKRRKVGGSAQKSNM